MAKKLFLWVTMAIYLSLLPNTTSFRLNNTTQDFKFSSKNDRVYRLYNLYSEHERNLLQKAITPNYLQDLFTLAKINEGFETSEVNYRNFIKSLVDGVTSESCKGHVAEWWWRWGPANLMNISSDKEKWVLQMLDSWGKLPEGILTGHMNSYGDFDECIQVKIDNLEILNDIYLEINIAKSFEGQYCTTYLVDKKTALEAAPKKFAEQLEGNTWVIQKDAVSLEELLNILFLNRPGPATPIPSVGVCMPNSCSQQDIQRIFVNGLEILYSDDSVDPEFPWPFVINCFDSNKPSLDGPTITVITLISVLAALSLGAGILDYTHSHMPENKMSSSTSRGTAYRYLMAFSLYTNMKKWLSTRRSPDDLGCLHGVRFFSTAWVVLEHTFTNFMQGPLWNQIDLRNIYKDWTRLPILNGSFSVDTFFLMSGMLATYNILKMLDKTKGKFNIIMFYVHRYIRLTPTYAILVAISATLLTYMGSGPNWTNLYVLEDICRRNWWMNILYINSLVENTYDTCNGETWYLANDMQFYILSPLIVYPIWKWKKIGLVLLTFYSILSCVSQVLVVRYAKDAPAATIWTGDMGTGEGLTEIYDRPWTRIAPFLVGIWLGWLLHKTRGKRIHLSRLQVLGLWIGSTGIAVSVIFGIYPWFNPANQIPEVSGYFYGGLSRFSWGVAVALVIFSCVKGYGGIINTFLSWKVFMPLGRLSFCVYLVSIHLQSVFHSRLTVPIKFDIYILINLFFAHMVMSYMVGLVCTLVFESPFIALHKLLFEAKVKDKVVDTQRNSKKADEEMMQSNNNDSK